jgi:5-formyltetrahydrofolate cyclo-ligase
VDEKNNLRQHFLTIRKQLDSTMVEALSKKIQNQFSLQWNFCRKNISCFLPMVKNKEVNTFYLLEDLGKSNSLWVPVTDFEKGTMEHVSFTKNTRLMENRYGIPEPIERENTINPIALDVIIIPLLAADSKGNRLGYGKGFYDRLLGNCSPETLRIGLSFFEPTEVLPNNEADEKLHFLVTPKRTISF